MCLFSLSACDEDLNVAAFTLFAETAGLETDFRNDDYSSASWIVDLHP